MNLFDHWDFGDPAASETRFRDAVAAADSVEARGIALTQVARALGLQEKFEDAQTTLAEADALLEEEGMGRAQYWVELGRVENSSGHPEAAMPLFSKALELAQRAGAEYLTCDAAHMLAIAAPLEDQIGYGWKALEMAKAAQEDRARNWVGPITNNLAWSYLDLERPLEALPLFEASIQFRLTQGKPRPIAFAYHSYGCALRVAGRPAEALKAQEEALAYDPSMAAIEEEIEKCNEALKVGK